MSEPGEWGQSGPAPAGPPPAGAGAPGPPRTHYPDVAAFLTHWLAPNYRRHIDGRTRTWCPEWYEHPEVVSRLDAMWLAWESLRQETAMGSSKFWLDHADRHMAVLLDVNGPLMGCTIARGHNPSATALPLTAPPAGLYPSHPLPARDILAPSPGRDVSGPST